LRRRRPPRMRRRSRVPKVLVVLFVWGVVVVVVDLGVLALALASMLIADLPLRWRVLDSAILAVGCRGYDPSKGGGGGGGGGCGYLERLISVVGEYMAVLVSAEVRCSTAGRLSSPIRSRLRAPSPTSGQRGPQRARCIGFISVPFPPYPSSLLHTSHEYFYSINNRYM